MKRKILAVIMSTMLMATTFCGFSSAATAKTSDLKGSFTIWTYFDQVKGMADAFMKKYPDVKIDVQIFPGDQYETKLRATLQSGQNVPDVFDLEQAYVGKFIDNPALQDLTVMGAASLVKNCVPYVTALGKDKTGKIKAVSDNSGPGGFWYNRASAKKYLGTDDPDKVSQLLSSWDKIMELSANVIKKSDGKVHLLAHYIDALKIEAPARKPFVQNGKFSIDPSWNQVINIMRSIRARNLDAKLGPWSGPWGSAINDGSVIAWAMPSWAGFFIDNKNGKANGTLGIARAPRAYFEGATMRAIYSKSNNKELAYEFLKYLASPEWQLLNLKTTGNMPSNLSVYTDNMRTFRDPLFGDENILKMYYDINKNVPANPGDKYREDVQNMFGGVLDTGIVNNLTNAQIFDQFRKKVANAYPEIKMDK